MKRNIYVGLGILALVAILGTGSVLVRSRKAVVHAADVMAPKFEVDALWPKPLPNHWELGDVIGLSMDAHDDVWIIHRPQTMDANESLHTRDLSDCCTAAPDVLEFDPAGN